MDVGHALHRTHLIGEFFGGVSVLDHTGQLDIAFLDPNLNLIELILGKVGGEFLFDLPLQCFVSLLELTRLVFARVCGAVRGLVRQSGLGRNAIAGFIRVHKGIVPIGIVTAADQPKGACCKGYTTQFEKI